MIFFLFEAAECRSLRFSEALSRAQALLLTELRKRIIDRTQSRGEASSAPSVGFLVLLSNVFFTHSISRIFTQLQSSCSATVFSYKSLVHGDKCIASSERTLRGTNNLQCEMSSWRSSKDKGNQSRNTSRTKYRHCFNHLITLPSFIPFL